MVGGIKRTREAKGGKEGKKRGSKRREKKEKKPRYEDAYSCPRSEIQ
jgi:hypothetical protein